MDISAKEAALKKKLQQFLLEMFRMGSVHGFLHFSMYLRGKEEMGLTVYHEPQVSSRRCSILNNSAPDISAGESFTSSNLPYDQQVLVLSQKTQVLLRGQQARGVGLPPASPSDSEQRAGTASNETLFLIAGYTRYSCPYVWVRSNHQRLMKMTRTNDEGKDNPLRLKSTTRWKDEDIHIWDVVAELVKLCMFPVPRNPFQVDMDYFRSLSLHRQLLATAAMMVCLQKIFLHISDQRPYAGKVLEDLQLVSGLHYTALHSLVTSDNLPVYKLQQQQQHSAKQEQVGVRSQRPSLTHRRDRYPSTDSTGKEFSSSDLYGGMTVQTTEGIYTPQGSAASGFPGYGFTPAPSLF